MLLSIDFNNQPWALKEGRRQYASLHDKWLNVGSAKFSIADIGTLTSYLLKVKLEYEKKNDGLKASVIIEVINHKVINSIRVDGGQINREKGLTADDI